MGGTKFRTAEQLAHGFVNQVIEYILFDGIGKELMAQKQMELMYAIRKELQKEMAYKLKQYNQEYTATDLAQLMVELDRKMRTIKAEINKRWARVESIITNYPIQRICLN